MSTGQQLDIVTADAQGRVARKYAVSESAGGGRAVYSAAALLIYGFVSYLKDTAFGSAAKIAAEEGITPSTPTAAHAGKDAAIAEQAHTTDQPAQPRGSDSSANHSQAASHTFPSRGSPLQSFDESSKPHSFGLGRTASAPLASHLRLPLTANDNIAPQGGPTIAVGSSGTSADAKARSPSADKNGQDTDPKSRNRAPNVSGGVLLDDLLVNTAIIITLADLLKHASDADADTLHVANVTASSGTIVNNGDGTWTYSPEVNDTGDVTLSYVITDGQAEIQQTAMIDLVEAASKTLMGTDDNDVLVGTSRDDVVYALDGHDNVSTQAGDDVIYAGPGNDIIHSGDGNDLIYAGDGNDSIFAGAGDDVVYGGEGNDIVSGDDGNDTLLGENGNDAISGGNGNDALFGGKGADTLIGDADRDFVSGGAGNDRMIATKGDGNDVYDGGDGTDTYDLSSLSTDTTVDLKGGTSDSNQSGHDDLTGIENVICGSGDDTITANEAQNVLTGGDGEDIFVFAAASDSGPGEGERDTITDFEVGDKIDVSKIDSDTKSEGYQKFEFKGDADHFEKAGELRYRFADDDRGSHTLVIGTVNDALADDFVIELSGAVVLTADDFLGLTQGLAPH